MPIARIKDNPSENPAKKVTIIFPSGAHPASLPGYLYPDYPWDTPRLTHTLLTLSLFLQNYRRKHPQ
jgi:hypothetical protein